MKPMTHPATFWFGAAQTLQFIQLDGRSSLCQEASGLELPLEESNLAGAVSANPILASYKRSPSMKHVEVVGVEVKAGDLIGVISVVRFPRSIRVGRQAATRPIADLLRNLWSDQEFDFGCELAVFPSVS